ncbi:hypothetical protein X975_13192, partial [Stegodyphus mimosarum]
MAELLSFLLHPFRLSFPFLETKILFQSVGQFHSNNYRILTSYN